MAMVNDEREPAFTSCGKLPLVKGPMPVICGGKTAYGAVSVMVEITGDGGGGTSGAAAASTAAGGGGDGTDGDERRRRRGGGTARNGGGNGGGMHRRVVVICKALRHEQHSEA